MLGYLLDPFIQINNVNGTPIVGAKIYVYNANTTNLAITYNDFEGHLNTNPVITDDLGNATIIADDGIEYDISIHDKNGLLLFTKKNVSIDKTSSDGGDTQVVGGYGVTVEKVGNVFTVSIDTDLIATKDDLSEKQDKLTAGNNIEITNDNTVNVVNRKELITQYPLRINKTNDRVKIYLDSDFYDDFKTKQTPVEFGGASGSYISSISQNANGEIEATVQETVLPSFDDIHAGDNITITRNGNDLTISSKDWTDDITSAVSGKLDTSTFTSYSATHANDDVTPYSGGTGISVSNHTISCTGDITPYSGGTGISVDNHTISCTGDITPYTAGSNISIANHIVSGKDWTNTINSSISGKLDTSTFTSYSATHANDDITPYTAGSNINITNHVVSGKDWTSTINSSISGKLDTSVFNTFTATTNSWDVTPYTAGDNIVINGHKISCTGDFSTYTPGSNIDIQNNEVSLTNNIELVDQGRLKIQNQTADKGSIVDASGFYVSNLTQDKYTDISKDHVHIRSTTDSKFATVDTTNISLRNNGNIAFLSTKGNPYFGLHSTVSGAEKSKIDAIVTDHQYARERAKITIFDNPDSTHVNTLTLDTTDVKLIESGGTNKIYSLKDACTPYTAGQGISVSNHVISVTKEYLLHYRLPKSLFCNKDGTRYTIYSQGEDFGISDQYTFSTLYNTSTQKYELELSNDCNRAFYVYIDGLYVDCVASRKKIYETSDTNKKINIELVGVGDGNQTPLYKFTAIFSDYNDGYNVSLYIDYDYNYALNI